MVKEILVFDESKDALLVALLVIISCLPQLDKLLHKFIPITEKSPYILFLIKGDNFEILMPTCSLCSTIKGIVLSNQG